MNCTLTIVRYPKYFGWAGILSMAVFRLPLWLNKKISFWKLLGCGKNGTFDIHPDWRQWGIFSVSGLEFGVSAAKENEHSNNIQETVNCELLYGSFIKNWFKFFRCEVYNILLQPIEGHGTWDGKEIFGALPKQTNYEGIIAVLTRATIRMNRLQNFWKHVDSVAQQMSTAQGFITSVGIGELPWIKQATFSVWESKVHMKTFAYNMQQHKDVIVKTRKEKWYSEDMFVRFKVIGSYGTLNAVDPLHQKI